MKKQTINSYISDSGRVRIDENPASREFKIDYLKEAFTDVLDLLDEIEEIRQGIIQNDMKEIVSDISNNSSDPDKSSQLKNLTDHINNREEVVLNQVQSGVNAGIKHANTGKVNTALTSEQALQLLPSLLQALNVSQPTVEKENKKTVNFEVATNNAPSVTPLIAPSNIANVRNLPSRVNVNGRIIELEQTECFTDLSPNENRRVESAISRVASDALQTAWNHGLTDRKVN